MKKILKLLIIFAVCLLIVQWSGYAVAAQEGGSQENAVMLEAVIVTATKTPEKRRDIPNSVVIVDKKDIQASGAKSVGDLLSNELGIDWRTRGNYGGAKEEIKIRGMESNATQVFVNGVNVNSPSLGDADVSKIPLNNIERIEVVKGSGSLLYGSGAMAGTVNIITKRPQKDKMVLKAEAGYGSQNTYRLSAEQGMFLAGDFGYYLTAGRSETDGFRDNSDLRHNDVSLKLVLDKKEAIDISLYGDYVDRTFGLPGVKPPEGTRDYYRSGVKFYNSEASSLLNKGGDKDGHLVLEVKGKPLKSLGYNLKGHYANMDGYNYTRYESTGKGKEDWVTNQVLGADGSLDIHPIDGATLLLGGEYKDFDWKSQSYGLDASGSPISETTTKARVFTKGAFAEGQYRPSQYWKALAGVRHEVNSMFGSENLPLFGLIINPFDTTAFKINHGKHFLAPSLNQLFWPEDAMGRGNPDLKPEIGWHTDVTAEQSFLDNKIFMTVSYFHWNVDDKIQWVMDTTGVSSPINLAGYKADGLEAGVRIGPYYDFTLALNYTYTDAEEENRAYTRQDYTTPDIRYALVKRRAAYTPDHQFKGDLIYRSTIGLTMTATARYMSDRVMYQTEKITTTGVNTKTVTYTLDPYWTMDLKMEQRLYKHWILSLSGNNLFDKAYDTYLATFTDRSKASTDPGRTVMCGYPGAGRSIFAGVAYEF
ncbi:MAG: TonB-dependent receptor [Deltaproteobacteria bacterium]|nr:TonB-dependent receptor [Deltaproteobacteria bacterium]